MKEELTPEQRASKRLALDAFKGKRKQGAIFNCENSRLNAPMPCKYAVKEFPPVDVPSCSALEGFRRTDCLKKCPIGRW